MVTSTAARHLLAFELALIVYATSSSAIAETALQGGLDLAKSGRLQGTETHYFADIIGLSSTTVT